MGTETPPTTETDDKALVLFDGECNLCNRSVRFIIKRDRSGRFRFAPVQSEAGGKILRGIGLRPENLETFVLVEGDAHYVKSDAVLRIARRLSGAWPLLGVLAILPLFFRNWIYDRIARNRYKWFGKRGACMVPTRDVRERFL